MDFTSFSHGQIQSKLWLCEQLEPFIKPDSKVGILGSWYNILGFMLLTRHSELYKQITGIDKDSHAIGVANKITEAWSLEDNKSKNIVQDVNILNMSIYDVVINCSVEHIETDEWFNKIKPNTLVCLQTVNVDAQTIQDWKICTPCHSLQEFQSKYAFTTSLYSVEKLIQYNDWSYKRYMIIGIK